MADVFVSYAAEDRDRIEPLIEVLQAEGWSVWWDRELLAGPSFSEKIQQELEAARCVIVAWSENAVTSSWCRDEAGDAMERGRLVPVLIDDVRLPLGFRSLQTASLLGWPAQRGDIERLIASVRALLDSPRRTADGTPAEGVAVLPFVNLSSDPEQDYFCDGLSEDLIDLLVRNSDLRVIARTSSFQFKGRTRDVREIGALLGVGHVVEGSVRRAGNRLRVVAQLVRTADGGHEWSERYDRDLEDIFELQDEIAGRIAAELNTALQQDSSRGRRDPQAHLKLLEARQLLDLSGGGSEVSVRAKNLLKEAVGIDPGYATAWVQLARAYSQIQILLSRYDSARGGTPIDDTTIEECDRLRDEAIRQALALEPGNLRIAADRAWVHFLRGDKAAAARLFNDAISRDPTDLDVLHGLVRPLGWANRHADAVRVAQHLVKRDPLNVVNLSNMAYVLFADDRVAEARAEVERALSISPSMSYAQWLSGIMSLLDGNPGFALEMADRFSASSVERYAMRTMAFHSLNQAQAADGALAELESRFPDKSYDIAGVHAWLGDGKRAFDRLHDAITRRRREEVFGAANTLIDPRWKPFHEDDRWQEFLEATHQTAEELARFDVDIAPILQSG